ncbi:DNA polymerase III subunit epsilon, partial [bacterium LRH843]|nr:DNA polymerase III subunit epsilon [bacterium LRH843]
QHPQIVITPRKVEVFGPRQLILDTETTGFYYQDGDRIIEVGAIEMVNRKLTGSSIHIYINPKKPVGDSENVHGISDDFLKDK